MTADIHRHFIRTARGISAPLHAAIAQVGRVSLPPRRGRTLAWFLCRVIVGQQLSTSAARSIWARIEAAVDTHRSTIPEFFIDRNKRTLRRCGLSRAKAKALVAIREAQEGGALSTRRLRGLGHVERSEHLQEIWGIGQWTADMTSIFYFGDLDVWPEGDISVRNTFLRLTGKRSRTTALKMASSFAPYRSFLALYMWQILDGPRKTQKRKPLNQKRPV